MTIYRRVNKPNTPLPENATEAEKAAWEPRITVDEPLSLDEEAQHLAKVAEHEKRCIDNAYVHKRKQQYPTILDQLDILYHQGYDGWHAVIKAVKDKYPKGGASE